MQSKFYYREVSKPIFFELLKNNNPIDKMILKSAQNGELKIGAVSLKNDKLNFLKRYAHIFLFKVRKYIEIAF